MLQTIRKALRSWYESFIYDESPAAFDKVASWLGIIGTIITILSFAGVEFENLWNDNIEFFANIKLWLVKYRDQVGIILGVSLVVFAVLVVKYRNLLIIKMNASALGISKVMEMTLTAIEELNALEAEIDESQCKNCDKLDISAYRKLGHMIFTQYTIHFLDELTELMSAYVSYDISACVKLVIDKMVGENNRQMSTMIEDKTIVTLARNSNTDEERIKPVKSEPVSITRNSDFYDIVNTSEKGNATYFYVQNLGKYSKKIKELTNNQHIYSNSNPNWREYYIGTAVVPIFGDVKTKDEKKGGIVWGFLCLDSMHKKAFTKSQKDINIKMLQGYANIYRLVAEKYEVVSNKIVDLKKSKLEECGGKSNVGN